MRQGPRQLRPLASTKINAHLPCLLLTCNITDTPYSVLFEQTVGIPLEEGSTDVCGRLQDHDMTRAAHFPRHVDKRSSFTTSSEFCRSAGPILSPSQGKITPQSHRASKAPAAERGNADRATEWVTSPCNLSPALCLKLPSLATHYSVLLLSTAQLLRSGTVLHVLYRLTVANTQGVQDPLGPRPFFCMVEGCDDFERRAQAVVGENAGFSSGVLQFYLV
jgi:hypothetical protein